MPNDPNNPDPSEVPSLRETLNALADQARILTEAWMLPRERPLTAEEVQRVRDTFQAYSTAHSLSIAKAADQVGYTASVLSEWLAGKYTGDNSSVARRVNDFVERDARRSRGKRPAGYVKTWVAECLRGIIQEADRRPLMAAIVAPAGCGKSLVLEAVRDEMNGVYIRCNQGMSPRGLLAELANALNIAGRKWSNATELQRHVVMTLKTQRRIVLLDEAHGLPPKTLSLVRTLFDLAGVAIILAGTDEILDAINDRHDGRGQFSRRCMRFNLADRLGLTGGPNDDSGRDLFTVEEVKSYFATLQMRLTRDGLEMLWHIACLTDYGTLGFAKEVAFFAASVARDEPISRRHVSAGLQAFTAEGELPVIEMRIRERVDRAARDTQPTARTA